jgi:hypothetical protein
MSMMSSTVVQPDVPSWVKSIRAVCLSYHHQIPYGNLRSEFSSWEEGADTVANLAIVYEVPGGSTNQINITYHEVAQQFSYLGLDAHEEKVTSSLDEVRQMVTEAVERIPAIRKRRLLEDIDRWAAQGLSQRDLFQKMNGLLKIEDLRGGTITMQEMKAGIAHILEHYRETVG